MDNGYWINLCITYHGEHEAGGVAGGSGDRGVGEPGGCWKALILEVIGPTK